MHPFENKLPDDHADALARAGAVFDRPAIAFNNLLPIEATALIDVEEGAMPLVVGEEVALEGQAGRRGRPR
jgi:hypothetical protein